MELRTLKRMFISSLSSVSLFMSSFGLPLSAKIMLLAIKKNLAKVFIYGGLAISFLITTVLSFSVTLFFVFKNLGFSDIYALCFVSGINLLFFAAAMIAVTRANNRLFSGIY